MVNFGAYFPLDYFTNAFTVDLHYTFYNPLYCCCI